VKTIYIEVDKSVSTDQNGVITKIRYVPLHALHWRDNRKEWRTRKTERREKRNDEEKEKNYLGSDRVFSL